MLIPLVGAAGFEPATSWSQTRRDDRTTLRPEKIHPIFSKVLIVFKTLFLSSNHNWFHSAQVEPFGSHPFTSTLLRWEREYLRCFRSAQVEPFGSHPFSSTLLRWERDYLRCFRSAQVEPFGSHPFSSTLLRWERDSNPRYSYPYDSLANCWFQPLTHPTKL